LAAQATGEAKDVDLYASADSTTAHAGWHYTVGWGNLFTVTVAVIAIAASVTVSVITLRRNTDQHEQSRIDARNDKLRSEVIDLISALSQRKSQAEILVRRIRQLESVDRQTIQQNIDAIFAEDLWDAYRRATSHAFAVLALTRTEKPHRRSPSYLEHSTRYENWLRSPPLSNRLIRWSTELGLTSSATKSTSPLDSSSPTRCADWVWLPTTNAGIRSTSSTYFHRNSRRS
jgi:hypothetical protein